MGETKEIERSVQMRLYSLHKRQFVGVFVVFFLCLSFTLLIGMAGPSVIQSTEYRSKEPPKQISGPYEVQSEYLDKFYQRLWLTMKSTTESNDEFLRTVNVTISVKNPSSPEEYKRQRTIHCQKQVS